MYATDELRTCTPVPFAGYYDHDREGIDDHNHQDIVITEADEFLQTEPVDVARFF